MRYVSLFFLAILASGSGSLFAQSEERVRAFPDTRIVNAHSGETLKKGFLEFRVDHKFGNLLGPTGGWETFYGLESATDIRIGFEYGITDQLMVGLGRTKGNGPVLRLVEGLAKYKLLEQTQEDWWPTVTLMANTVASTMRKSLNPEAISHFPEWHHRLSFLGQVIISRQIGKKFSVAAIPTYLHRNYVAFHDVNDLYFLGVGTRFEFTKGWALVGDLFVPLSTRADYQGDYYPPLGIAIEYETGGGHIFQVNFANNEGIVANDFLPYTDTNWLDRQFRFGFFIVRKFVL